MSEFGKKDAKDINQAVAGGFAAAFPAYAGAIKAGANVVDSQILDRFVPMSDKEQEQARIADEDKALAAKKREVERKELEVRAQLADLRQRQLAAVLQKKPEARVQPLDLQRLQAGVAALSRTLEQPQPLPVPDIAGYLPAPAPAPKIAPRPRAPGGEP